MVSHYDCAKQNNLIQFSLLIVEPCKQAPSDIQHTKTQATVYVRAKAKRIKAFKCEAYIKTEKVLCSISGEYLQTSSSPLSLSSERGLKTFPFRKFAISSSTLQSR